MRPKKKQKTKKTTTTKKKTAVYIVCWCTTVRPLFRWEPNDLTNTYPCLHIYHILYMDNCFQTKYRLVYIHLKAKCWYSVHSRETRNFFKETERVSRDGGNLHLANPDDSTSKKIEKKYEFLSQCVFYNIFP